MRARRCPSAGEKFPRKRLKFIRFLTNSFMVAGAVLFGTRNERLGRILLLLFLGVVVVVVSLVFLITLWIRPTDVDGRERKMRFCEGNGPKMREMRWRLEIYLREEGENRVANRKLNFKYLFLQMIIRTSKFL